MYIAKRWTHPVSRWKPVWNWRVCKTNKVCTFESNICFQPVLKWENSHQINWKCLCLIVEIYHFNTFGMNNVLYFSAINVIQSRWKLAQQLFTFKINPSLCLTNEGYIPCWDLIVAHILFSRLNIFLISPSSSVQN